MKAEHPFVIRGGLSSLAGAIAMALAGTGTAQAPPGAELEEITVTGTRVRVTDGMAEPVPVTTLTPDELKTFEPGSTIAEQLDALPQFFNSGTAQRGGPGLFGDGGGSYLDMRGLGRDRTLVLFDGLRVPPADKRGQVNVDTLPTALVRSVDIVTGGASAAYGADALGGVTNFVLDREFEGIKFSAGTGMNDFNNDGKNYNLSFAGGFAIGERLNIIGSIETRHVDEVARNPADLDPSWFQRWGYVNNAAWRASDPPGTNPRRLVVPWAAPAGPHVNGKITGATGPGAGQLNNRRFTDDGSALVPFGVGCINDGTVIAGCADAITSHLTQPGGPATSEVEQTNAFFGIKFAVTDSVALFGDILIGSVESNSTPYVSAATWTGIWAPTVYRENAYLPPSVRSLMGTSGPSASFRLNKAGSYPGVLDVDTFANNINDFDTEMFRIGVDWDMSDRWQMRFSMQTGETEKMTGEFGSLRVDRVALATDAVEVYNDRRDVTGDTVDPVTGNYTGAADGRPDLVNPGLRGTGTIVCNVQRYNPTPAQLAATPAIQGARNPRDVNLPLASPIGLDNSVRDCVPFNIMGNGRISQAAYDYIMTPKWGESIVEQDFAELLVTGEVSDGWGAGPLSLATGLSYREQSFSDGGFPIDVTSLGPPYNAPELGIRGIASAWSGGSPNLHQFSTVSLLYGQYDVWEAFGELNVPFWESVSGNQHFGSSFSYRSSDYSSVGRIEAWKIGIDFQMTRDLRFRGTKSRDVREATFSERFDNSPNGGTVTLDPVTGASNVVVTATSAGNPNLRPEVADTVVVGLVYQPSWAEGLRMSVDRYEVDIADAIATLTDDDVVDECFEHNVLCENVIRDSAGNLARVLLPYLNLNQAYVQGIDFEIAYNRDVDWLRSPNESFSVRALGGKLENRKNTVEGSVPDEFAGALFGPSGYPELTATVTASYRFGPWSLQVQERYIDSVRLDRNWVEGVDIDDNTIESQTWTNFVLGYGREMQSGSSWRLSFNVQNLFDDDPPIIPGTGGGRFGAQALSNTYDTWGRRYQLGFNMDF